MIVWSTDFRPNYLWLDVPVFDRKDRLRQSPAILSFFKRTPDDMLIEIIANLSDTAEHGYALAGHTACVNAVNVEINQDGQGLTPPDLTDKLICEDERAE